MQLFQLSVGVLEYTSNYRSISYGQPSWIFIKVLRNFYKCGASICFGRLLVGSRILSGYIYNLIHVGLLEINRQLIYPIGEVSYRVGFLSHNIHGELDKSYTHTGLT